MAEALDTPDRAGIVGGSRGSYRRQAAGPGWRPTLQPLDRQTNPSPTVLSPLTCSRRGRTAGRVSTLRARPTNHARVSLTAAVSVPATAGCRRPPTA